MSKFFTSSGLTMRNSARKQQSRFRRFREQLLAETLLEITVI